MPRANYATSKTRIWIRLETLLLDKM